MLREDELEQGRGEAITVANGSIHMPTDIDRCDGIITQGISTNMLEIYEQGHDSATSLETALSEAMAQIYVTSMLIMGRIRHTCTRCTEDM